MLILSPPANLAFMERATVSKNHSSRAGRCSMGSDKEPAGHIGPAYLLSSVAKGEVLSVSQPLGK